MHKDLPQDRAIKKSYREEEDAILHLEPESVVSTTECTGLVQAEIRLAARGGILSGDLRHPPQRGWGACAGKPPYQRRRPHPSLKKSPHGLFFNSKTSEEISPSFAPPVTLKHILGFLRHFMSFYAFLWVFYRSFSTKTLLFHPNKSYN